MYLFSFTRSANWEKNGELDTNDVPVLKTVVPPFKINEEEAIQAMEIAVGFAENKTVNTAGIELGQRFTYENTVSQICDIMAQLQ